MRNRIERERDRNCFCQTKEDTEPTPVILGAAIRELCRTIDEAAELIVAALKNEKITTSHDVDDQRVIEVLKRMDKTL